MKDLSVLSQLAEGENLENDNPNTIMRPISCEEWGCDTSLVIEYDNGEQLKYYYDDGYYLWWLNNMPQKVGE